MRLSVNTYISIAVLLLGLIQLSCDAPRDNPLDPDNTSNKIYSIEGTLLSGEVTPNPVSGASVSWPPENLYTVTDQSGYFNINCTTRVNGWLYFEKTGFTKDSVYVNWNGQKKAAVQPRLNYLPVIDVLDIYSSIKNKYSVAEYQLFFDVTLHDPDDDITGVKIENSDLQISKSLTKITSTYFEGRFSDIELNITAFDEVVGKRFDLKVFTASGDSFQLQGKSIVRIVKDEVIVISPINSDTLTTTTPLLNWTRLTPGFNFSYTIEVYTDETEPVLQWKKENISSEEVFMTVETPLTVSLNNNKFFWVIWCIDNYKNKSRSKPAGFVIK